jgi:hypothetical protein
MFTNFSDPHEISFKDLVSLIAFVFMLLLLIVIPFLNPPTKEQEGDIIPPGNVNVHIQWDKGNTDVDLWVFGPKELKPVGYSNKGGFVWNLVRDDLGRPDEGLNYENSYSRGLFPGEYIINLHCYRCDILPIHVKVEVSIKTGHYNFGKKAFKVIAKTELDLLTKREEITAIRFRLTEDGEVISGSMNHIFKPLRDMK